MLALLFLLFFKSVVIVVVVVSVYPSPLFPSSFLTSVVLGKDSQKRKLLMNEVKEGAKG